MKKMSHRAWCRQAPIVAQIFYTILHAGQDKTWQSLIYLSYKLLYMYLSTHNTLMYSHIGLMCHVYNDDILRNRDKPNGDYKMTTFTSNDNNRLGKVDTYAVREQGTSTFAAVKVFIINTLLLLGGIAVAIVITH